MMYECIDTNTGLIVNRIGANEMPQNPAGKPHLLWREYENPPPVPPTINQIKVEMTNAVQEHLDSVAQGRGYDNILSACSYAGAPNAFQAESQAFIVWRADVWVACYQIMVAVESGTRAVPAVDQLLAELPQMQ